MVAAFLPIPPDPTHHKFEKDLESTHPVFRQQQQVFNEKRYESARWWRNLNRIMSVVGLLIIGAVVALAVIGVKQGWGQR